MIATDNIGDSLFNAYLQGIQHGRQSAVDASDVASRIQSQLNSQASGASQDDNNAFNRALQVDQMGITRANLADQLANSRYNRNAIASNQAVEAAGKQATLNNSIYQKQLTDAYANLDSITPEAWAVQKASFHPLDAAMLDARFQQFQKDKGNDFQTQNRVADLLNQKQAVTNAQALVGNAGAPDQDVIKALTAARVTPDFGFGWSPSTSRTGQLFDQFSGGDRNLPTVFNRTAATAPLTDRSTQIQNALAMLMPPKSAPANFVTQGPNGAYTPLVQNPTQPTIAPRQIVAPPIMAPQMVAAPQSPPQLSSQIPFQPGQIPPGLLAPQPRVNPALAGIRPPVSPTQITTKEQFLALPPGTIYIGKDGRKYRKP